MPVSVVDVRVVGMSMSVRLMNVRVSVRLARINSWRVFVLVVLIVDVFVRVGHVFMPVFVLMPLGQVEPYPGPHKSSGQEEERTKRFPQEKERHHGPDKWS